MLKRSNITKLVSHTASIVFILIILTSFSINIAQSQDEDIVKPIVTSNLIQHEPFNITTDGELELLPGLGTSQDPYIIENYSIVTSEFYGIFILNTTKHFVIQNCYIETSYTVGISIREVETGTVKVLNNTIANCANSLEIVGARESIIMNNTGNGGEIGLYMWDCENSIIQYNSFNYNAVGIHIIDCPFCRVARNTCNGNIGTGILINHSGQTIVTSNFCRGNSYGVNILHSSSSIIQQNNIQSSENHGLALSESSNCNVSYNLLFWNSYGMNILHSSSSIIHQNIIQSSENHGLAFSESSNCNATYNLLYKNTGYGIVYHLEFNESRIHHNTFAYNGLAGTQQAKDETGNTWYDENTLEGNWWNDWTGIGSYNIDGLTEIVDPYPLATPPYDPYPPIIYEIENSPESPTNINSISINATVTDISGIQAVFLYYRLDEGYWTNVEMLPLIDDKFSATIGPFNSGEKLEYFILAIDNSKYPCSSINDNNGEYYSIAIVENTDKTSIDIAIPLLISFSILTGLMVIKRKKM